MTPANLCPSPSPLQVERLGNGLCCTLPKDANLPDVSNRLAHESSLYLRQHEANPVHWWPWCAEAFAEAKAKDKPVLVSVGYSSCHWCHVMARESFEQPWIAPLFDRLAEAQVALARGEDGTGKYLSCTHSTLRQIAERRPASLQELGDLQGMGAQKVERFGAAFLDILQAG